MLSRIKLIIQFIGGIVLIILALWFLTTQFAFISSKMKQVVSTDIPIIKNRLDENSKATEKMKTDMDNLTKNIAAWGDRKKSIKKIETNIDLLIKKVNDELIQEGKGSEQNIETIKILAHKIDKLSKKYVRLLKLAEDKIIVSIPPKWIDELPHRRGTIFALGISSQSNKLTIAQQRALKQARSNVAMMLQRKTFNAVRHAIESAGKPYPNSLKELTPEFKHQITEAINELLVDSQIESYWVDPNGYVYALVSLSIEKYLEGSKLGILIETLRLTKQSITETLTDSTIYPKTVKDTRENKGKVKTIAPPATLATDEEVVGGEKERTTPLLGEHARSSEKEVIQKFILEWKHEWESKDHENYMRRYSREFTSRDMDWNQWSAYKKDLSERYHQISLTFKDIHITLANTNTQAVVSFKQYYRSDDYSDHGMKSLVLKKDNGEWKIFAEQWKPLPGWKYGEILNIEM
ncbi:MAG: hypothetical protein JRJ00_14930 [Deltaproteobacteria bacterium]|nr:hypothetical protein [Deltaproteobacteria bacterium]